MTIANNTLEVGTNGRGEIVINHPDLMPDKNGVGHIVFSVDQARHLASLLNQKASDAWLELEAKRMEDAKAIPVDRSCRVLVGANVILAHDPTRSELARREYQRIVDAGISALQREG